MNPKLTRFYALISALDSEFCDGVLTIIGDLTIYGMTMLPATRETLQPSARDPRMRQSRASAST